MGRAPYRVVVIPPGTRTLLASTVDLLARFLDAGGKLIAFHPLPEWIEAAPDASPGRCGSKPGVSVSSRTRPSSTAHSSRSCRGVFHWSRPRASRPRACW